MSVTRAKNAAGNTIFKMSDGTIYELINHVNSSQLQEIVNKVTGLTAHKIVKSGKKAAQNQQDILFGMGTFFKAGLAKKTNPDGTVEYVVVKKLLSEEKLQTQWNKHNEQLKENILKQLNSLEVTEKNTQVSKERVLKRKQSLLINLGGFVANKAMPEQIMQIENSVNLVNKEIEEKEAHLKRIEENRNKLNAELTALTHKMEENEKKRPPRSQLLNAIDTELLVLSRVKDIPEVGHPTESFKCKNKKGEDQFYRFYPIASLGSISDIKHLMNSHSEFVMMDHDYDIDMLRKEILLELINRFIQIVIDMHARNVYHGDIKPDNMLVLSDGRPLLIDFGSAIWMTANEKIVVSTLSDAFYFPPLELFENLNNKAAAHDQWALAMMILQLFNIEISVLRKLVDDFNNQPDKLAVSTQYREKYVYLLSQLNLEKLPLHLQIFVRNALNLQNNRFDNLAEMVVLPQNTETHKYENAIAVVKTLIARNNTYYFAAQQPVEMKQSTEVISEGYKEVDEDKLTSSSSSSVSSVRSKRSASSSFDWTAKITDGSTPTLSGSNFFSSGEVSNRSSSGSLFPGSGLSGSGLFGMSSSSTSLSASGLFSHNASTNMLMQSGMFTNEVQAKKKKGNSVQPDTNPPASGPAALK